MNGSRQGFRGNTGQQFRNSARTGQRNAYGNNRGLTNNRNAWNNRGVTNNRNAWSNRNGTNSNFSNRGVTNNRNAWSNRSGTSRIVAMSFCEPRSCIGRLSS